MQKLITMVVGGLIIYALMSEKLGDLHKAYPKGEEKAQEDNNQQDKNEPAPEGNFLERSLSKVLINVLKTDEGKMFFEHLIQPVNKPLGKDGIGFKLDNSQFIQSMFKIKTLGERREAGPVSCGHIVTARYQISTLSNALVEETTKTFNVGGNSVMLGLSDIVVGMYEGETREGIVMPQYAIGAKDPSKAYKVKVTVQSIIPRVFADSTRVKIFDDEISYQRPYLCGERAVFDVKISKCNGEVIYDSQKAGQKVNMVLGDLAYPMIFSHALFAKIPSGTRTVIAPGVYLRSLATAKINRIFLKEQPPAEEFYLLEFKNFEDDGRSASSPLVASPEKDAIPEDLKQKAQELKSLLEKLPRPKEALPPSPDKAQLNEEKGVENVKQLQETVKLPEKN